MARGRRTNDSAVSDSQLPPLGLGFRALGLALVWGSGPRVWAVQGLGFRVEGSFNGI